MESRGGERGRGQDAPTSPASPPFHTSAPPSPISYPLVKTAGDGAALVVLGEEMSAETSLRVQGLARALEAVHPAGILDMVPAYCTLLIHFDPEETSFPTISSQVNRAFEVARGVKPPQPRVREIPTVYGGERGPDLPEVASRLGLTEEEVIHLHSGATYLVCFLGFAPGQPYVVGLPPGLALPRRSSPRERVPAGAVTIANQTNIYPMDNPTGWWWIGQTPVSLFDPAQDSPTLLLPGDEIRFVRVDEAEYRRLDGNPDK